MRRFGIVIAIGLVGWAAWWAADRPAEGRRERARPDREPLRVGTAKDVDAVEDSAPADQLEVLVLDEVTEKPIRDAVVVVRPLGKPRSPAIRVRTDTVGRALLRSNGKIRVHVLARGYRVEDHKPESESLRVLLERAPPRTLTIVDIFDQPIAHAVVFADQAPGLRFPADRAGRIVLDVHALTKVVAKGFAGRYVAATVDQRRVVLRPGFVLAGRVRYPDGSPAIGVGVWLLEKYETRAAVEEGATPRAKTDDAGRFVVRDLAAWSYPVTVVEDGYLTAHFSDASAGDTNIELVLTRPASLSVQLLLPGGQPATEAFLYSFDLLRYLVESRSDEAGKSPKTGRYSFEGLKPVEYSLRATFDGFEFHRKVVTKAGEDREVRWVLSPESGKPYLSYMKVRVLGPEGQPLRNAMVNRFRTDAQGLAVCEFEMGAGGFPRFAPPNAPLLRGVGILPPEEMKRVLAYGVVEGKTYASPEEAVPVEVELQRLVPFAVKVVDQDGRPVPAHAYIDEDEDAFEVGEWAWLVNPRRRYRVDVSADDDSYQDRDVSDLPPGTHTIVLEKYSRLKGRVVDEDGDPVAGAYVWVEILYGLLRTDSQGRFLAERVDSGDWGVRFGRGVFDEAERQVEFSGGRDVDLGDVVLRPSKHLSGVVKDAAGRPLGGVAIEENRRYGEETRSHPNGRFQVRVAPMTRHLQFSREGYGFTLVALDAVGEVVLELPGTLVCAGSEEARVGWPQTDGTIGWIDWDSLEYEHDLRPGPLTVELRDKDGKTQRHEVTIVQGKSVEVKWK